ARGGDLAGRVQRRRRRRVDDQRGDEEAGAALRLQLLPVGAGVGALQQARQGPQVNGPGGDRVDGERRGAQGGRHAGAGGGGAAPVAAAGAADEESLARGVRVDTRRGRGLVGQG